MIMEIDLFLTEAHQQASVSHKLALTRTGMLVRELTKEGHDVSTVAGFTKWLKATHRDDIARRQNISHKTVDAMLEVFNLKKPKDGRRDKVAADITKQLSLTPEQKITVLHILAKWQV